MLKPLAGMDLIHRRAGDGHVVMLLKRAVTACRLCPTRPAGMGQFRPSGPRLGQAEQAISLQARWSWAEFRPIVVQSFSFYEFDYPI
jgi:hypothetical protein